MVHRCGKMPDNIGFIINAEPPRGYYIQKENGEYLEDFTVENCPWCGVALGETDRSYTEKIEMYEKTIKYNKNVFDLVNEIVLEPNKPYIESIEEKVEELKIIIQAGVNVCKENNLKTAQSSVEKIANEIENLKTLIKDN